MSIHKISKRYRENIHGDHPVADELREDEKQKTKKPDRPEEITLSIPEAGRRYFNLSRNGSYAAADRGDLPTIKVGKLRRVPIRVLERRLEAAR